MINEYTLKDQYTPFFKVLWQTFFVFFFIYEVQHFVMPDLLTSRKLMFYLAAILFFIKYNHYYYSKRHRGSLHRKTTRNLVLLGLVMVFWQLFLTLINTNAVGEPILGRTILFFVLTSLFCVFSYFLFDNLKQFLLSTFFASILQSIIVIADFFSDAVKQFFYNNFVLDANFGYLSPMRAAGLGAGESLLSIDLYLGLVAASILILTSKKISIYVIGYIVILFSCFLAGTTGFLLGLTLLLVTITILILHGNLKQKVSVSLILFGGIVLLFTLAASFFSEIDDFRNFTKITDLWDLGVEDQATVSTLKSQKVAPLSSETLLGTSLYRGTINGITTMSDTGYIQSYFGHGLIFAFIFYFVLYRSMIINIKAVKNKMVFLVLVFFGLSIALAEAKEPYIYHYGITFVFFLICFLAQKNQKYS